MTRSRVKGSLQSLLRATLFHTIYIESNFIRISVAELEGRDVIGSYKTCMGHTHPGRRYWNSDFLPPFAAIFYLDERVKLASGIWPGRSLRQDKTYLEATTIEWSPSCIRHDPYVCGCACRDLMRVLEETIPVKDRSCSLFKQ